MSTNWVSALVNPFRKINNNPDTLPQNYRNTEPLCASVSKWHQN